MLAPIALPVALVAAVWPGKKTNDRTPEEVVRFIEDFLNGTGGEWDWDEFESVPIADPRLDALRRRAALAGPPGHDEVTLRTIAAEARALASA
jgi:hypothetical protein